MGFLDYFRKKRNLPANHDPPNFKVLAEKTHFTKNEVEVIYNRFLALCNYDTGMVEKVPFVQQPELSLNPIIDLAYDMECKNFLNLRLLVKKGEDDRVEQDMLRALAQEKSATRDIEEKRLNQTEGSDEGQRKRRHKKRHRKKKKDIIASDLEVNDKGSLGSLEDRFLQSGSVDESLDSIDGQHVHSVNVSEDGMSRILEDAEVDTCASGNDNDVNNGDYENSSINTEEADVGFPSRYGAASEHSSGLPPVESTEDTADGVEGGKSSDQDTPDESTKIKLNGSDVEEVTNTQRGDEEAVPAVGREESPELEELGKVENGVPPLEPMTSSFFRAQQRLKQMEDAKSQASAPPLGLDFTHFILILNEFSPKASISAKTSYFFKIIAVNNSGCISKQEYLGYLKRITYGLVPEFLYDEFIDDMWENVCSRLAADEREISRKTFSKFIATIDVNLFMTIPY